MLPAEPQPAMQQLRVLVPTAVSAGQEVSFRTPDNQDLRVRAAEDLQPGAQLVVQYQRIANVVATVASAPEPGPAPAPDATPVATPSVTSATMINGVLVRPTTFAAQDGSAPLLPEASASVDQRDRFYAKWGWLLYAVGCVSLFCGPPGVLLWIPIAATYYCKNKRQRARFPRFMYPARASLVSICVLLGLATAAIVYQLVLHGHHHHGHHHGHQHMHHHGHQGHHHHRHHDGHDAWSGNTDADYDQAVESYDYDADEPTLMLNRPGGEEDYEYYEDDDEQDDDDDDEEGDDYEYYEDDVKAVRVDADAPEVWKKLSAEKEMKQTRMKLMDYVKNKMSSRQERDSDMLKEKRDWVANLDKKELLGWKEKLSEEWKKHGDQHKEAWLEEFADEKKAMEEFTSEKEVKESRLKVMDYINSTMSFKQDGDSDDVLKKKLDWGANLDKKELMRWNMMLGEQKKQSGDSKKLDATVSRQPVIV